MNATPKKYAILLEAERTATQPDKVYQLAVLEADTGLVWFSRTTNGKRGLGNAWQLVTQYADIQTYSMNPCAVAMSDGQAAIVSSFALGMTDKMPSNTLAELQRQIRVPMGRQRTNSEMIALVENALMNERDLLETWNKGVDEVEVKLAEEKVEEPALWFTNRPRSDYALPEQADDLYSWANLSVPDPDTIENKRYVQRIIAGLTLHQWFDHALDRGKSVVINGAAGTGKTSAAYNYAAKLGVPFTTFECNPQIDKNDIQGKYVPTGDGSQLLWRYSALATAISREGVVLLNEVTRMTPKANSLFMSLLAEKRLIIDQHHNEVIQVHPRCLIIADANPDYRGTMMSDEAFQDRFLVKLEFEYDNEIEKQFIPSESLLEMATELRRASDVEGKFSTPISTRLLISFVDVALDLGYEPAVYNFINSFPPSEREPLSLLFNTYEENIMEDLKSVKVAN
jgi:hypothetical protein